MAVTRETLYEDIWNNSLAYVAKKYGVSETTIRKKCTRFNIPLPNNSYRRLQASGKNPAMEPLPKFTGKKAIIFKHERPNEVGTLPMLESSLFETDNDITWPVPNNAATETRARNREEELKKVRTILDCANRLRVVQDLRALQLAILSSEAGIDEDMLKTINEIADWFDPLSKREHPILLCSDPMSSRKFQASLIYDLVEPQGHMERALEKQIRALATLLYEDWLPQVNGLPRVLPSKSVNHRRIVVST